MGITGRQTGQKLMMADQKVNIRGVYETKNSRMDSPALTTYTSLPLSSFSATLFSLLSYQAKC